MIHMGHLRLALPTTHALAQTCMLLCPSIPIESPLSLLPGFVILARGSTTSPSYLLVMTRFKLKALAKNPYYHIWAPGYLAIMFMS